MQQGYERAVVCPDEQGTSAFAQFQATTRKAMKTGLSAEMGLKHTHTETYIE